MSVSPIVKWAGGKSRLMPQLSALLPADVERMRHVELFAGGAAMFFALRRRRAMLADANADLIATYVAVRDNVELVIRHLRRLRAEHGKRAFYRVRERYNDGGRASPTSRAAMFLYLNRTCFNGLYRVNAAGRFNVPVGRYDDPEVVRADNLRAASRLLRGVKLVAADFRDTAHASVLPGDFVYLDPPYAPTSKTARFASYTLDGFGASDLADLRSTFEQLTRRGCTVMLSQADTPAVRELFADWPIVEVAAARSINSSGERRGVVRELVVRNYGGGRGQRKSRPCCVETIRPLGSSVAPGRAAGRGGAL